MLESLALKALAVMPSYASPVQCNSPNMVERLRCLINSNKLQLPKHRWTANALQTTPKQSDARTASPPKYGRVRSVPWEKKVPISFKQTTKSPLQVLCWLVFDSVLPVKQSLQEMQLTKHGFYRWRVVNFNLGIKSRSQFSARTDQCETTWNTKLG